MRLTGVIERLADTSAQIRVRLTVLLVAGLALAAQMLGFEAILGAFLAGLLVRALDPDPLVTHLLYPVNLEAVGYGLLVPAYFVNSGLTLDFSGFVEHPAALVTVLAFLLAFLLERGAPALAFRRDLGRAEVLAVCLLQATSLTFLLAAVAIGHEMGLLDPAVLTDYLEGVLPAAKVAAIEAHLEVCPPCRIYLAQLRATIDALGLVPVETLSDEACSRLPGRLR